MRALNPNDPNVVMLELVARRLGAELCAQLAFVGGAIAGLLITDPAMPQIRPTEDVDLIAHVAALSEYHRVERMLRAQGFVPDLRSDAPMCRWRVDTVTVDVMPTREEILGFSNRWYEMAAATAQAFELPSGTGIRLIRSPLFVGTKLEAFHSRGAQDYLFSHDLGDILSVVDGRDSFIDECRVADEGLQAYLSQQFGALLSDRRFLDALPGHLPADAASQQRLPDLQARLRQLASLTPSPTST